MSSGKPSSYRAFLRVLLPLLLPIAGRNVINSAVSVADVLMLGRLGELALSGASLGGQAFFVMSMTVSGLVSGASILISQYWGRGDARTAERVLALTLRFSVPIGTAFFLLACFAPRTVLALFTSDPQIARAGALYLRIISPSFLIIMVTDVYFGALAATDRVMVSTLTKLGTFTVNIGLNYVLIFGKLGLPALGLAGAALATAAARLTELCAAAIYAATHRDIRIRLGDVFRSQGVLYGDFLRYCVPTTLNDVLWVCGASAASAIIGRLGAGAVAAYSVGCQIREFTLVFSYGIASASAIVIGKTLGSGDLELARDYSVKMLRTSLAVGAAAGALVFASRLVMPRVVNVGGEAEAYLRYLLTIMPFLTVFQSFTTLVNLGIFRAGGDPRFALRLDFLTMWGLNVGLGCLSAFVLRLPIRATMFIIMMDETVKAPILYWRYRKGVWIRNITRELPPRPDSPRRQAGGTARKST